MLLLAAACGERDLEPGGAAGSGGAAGAAGAVGAAGRGGSTAQVTDRERTLCAKLFERHDRCDIITNSTPQVCEVQFACQRAWLDPSQVDAYYTCLGGRMCQDTMGTCVTQVSSGTFDTTFIDRCRMRQEACWRETSYASEYAFTRWCSTLTSVPWPLFSAPTSTALLACLGEGCRDIAGCLEQTADRLGGGGCFPATPAH